MKPLHSFNGFPVDELGGMQISGRFKVLEIQARTSPDGRRFKYLLLGNESVSPFQVVLWLETFLCTDPNRLVVGREYLVNLRQTQEGRERYIQLLDIQPIEHSPAFRVDWSCLPHTKLADQLESWILALPVYELIVFLEHAFNDPALTTRFLTLPASQQHHHARPGGLAEHSMEVAVSVNRLLQDQDEAQRVLASVAGLLHDFGKTTTHQGDGRRTATGHVLDHEALTLELLAPALKALEAMWFDGALALRYLLSGTHSARNTQRPLMPALIAIRSADQLSAAHDAQRQAFHDKPAWHRFASLDIPGPPSRFWIPKMPPTLRSVQAGSMHG